VSESAVDVAKNVLLLANHDLHELARFSVADLKKVKGIGEAKAITLIAAMELSRRRKEQGFNQRTQITSSAQAHAEIRRYLQDKAHEEFWVLLLNRNNEVIRPVQISMGGVAGTVVDAKVVFKYALDSLASSIILIHNHPSGNLKPSEADRTLTRQLVEAGKLLSIPVLDHLIFADAGYFSFADDGIL
jgi:DNA repair protein RadC